MGKLAGTLIGGGIGWALFGPLGAIIGAYIGSMLSEDSSSRVKGTDVYEPYADVRYSATKPGDFAVSMLTLFAYVSKADRIVKSSEVQYVKNFLIEKFGKENAQDLLYLYREILNKDFDIKEVANQIRMHMDYYARVELLHVIFGIAAADGEIKEDEIQAIKLISDYLGIYRSDFENIQAIFIPNNYQAYKILGVSPSDDIETIKKAYRELANKYHPDRVANLGPEIQKLAEEKFKAINEAYQKVRQEKGF